MAVPPVMPDLPSFRVVPPRPDLRLDDMQLPDGTPMTGPDGLLIPAARSFSMIVNSATRVYSYRSDEAIRDSLAGARAMRRDAFLRGLFEERILPTINREWMLEVDDAERPEQRMVRDGLTQVIKAIPDFDAFKRANLDGVWFGKAGCQWAYERKRLLGDKWCLSRWDPLHGDSIQFTYDGVPAILMDSQTVSWYADHGAKFGPPGTGDLVPTDRGGIALVLNRPYWRDRFSVHVHMREKADYFEGEMAGSVQGLGLRGLVYLQYMVRTDALTWMLAYMQAVGQMDLLVFNYPWNNAEAKAQQEANAAKVIGKAAIACPRNPTQNWSPIEQIQMNSAGLKALHDLVADYFDRHIERLFVGQSMSAGADKGTGLGGTGRADFARATKDEIIVYDTGRLDSTMSNDLVAPLLKYNYPWADFGVRFKSVMPDVKAKEKVEAGSKMISVGVPIKLDEFREAGGYSKPKAGEEVIATVIPGAPPMITIMGPNGPEPPPMMGGPQPGQIMPQATPGGSVPGMPPGMMPGQGAMMPQMGGQMPPQLPQGGGGQPMQNAAYGPVGGVNAPFYGPLSGRGGPIRHEGGGSPGAGPAMGYPGGGNTYVPGWDRERRIGLTRHAARSGPVRYSRGTHADHLPFHAKIAENTREHTPKLVYADWLEENGQPALASFIREVVNTEQTGYQQKHRHGRTIVYSSPQRAEESQEHNAVFAHVGLGRYTSRPTDRLGRPRGPKPPETIDVSVQSPHVPEIGGRMSFGLDVPEPEAKEWIKRLAAEGHPAGNPTRSSTIKWAYHDLERARQAAEQQPPEQLSRYARTDYRDGPFDYCSTQIDLDGYAAILVNTIGRAIRQEDLAEKGRETEPHVTLLFGILPDEDSSRGPRKPNYS